jgi:hypothetical protein
VLIKVFDDHPAVENELEKLKKDTLSSGLRTDKYRQIPEAHVRFTNRSDVFQNQRVGHG